MKKTKILTIAGVLLAMALTGCKTGGKTSESKAPGTSGNPTSQPTSQPTSNPSTNPSTSGGGQSTSTTPAPQIHIHDLEGSEKVDVLEEEGAVAEEMYKCKDCDKYAVAWSALDYDKTKTTERSTSGPESRASGKAIRFSSTANYQDADVTKKGCHIVYNVYLPEAVENANLLVKMAKRTDTNDVFARYEDDNAKGYEYVPQASGDPVLERPATRYGIKLDGNVYIIPEDNTNQSWKDNTGWYQFPGQLPALTAGAHEVEIYNLGGFRTDMYNFALVGFGPHEHVNKFEVTERKLNEDGKPVSLGVDSFSGAKAAMVEMKDISGAYASSKTSAEGEPEAFGLGDQDTAFKAANTYKLDKGKVIAFKVNLSAEVKGAKIEVGAEFKNAERYFYNMKIRGNETMTDNNADKDTEDAWRYYVKVNEGAFQPMGCEDKMQDVLDKTAGKYMPLGTFDLKAGANMIYIRQGNIGYRVTFDNPLRVIFKGDATITGDHAHLFDTLVSKSDATCTEQGEEVWKCMCGETNTVKTPALGHDLVKGDGVDNSEGKKVYPLTCQRANDAEGFEMGLKDCDADGAAKIENDGKVKNGTELKYKFKVGNKVGKVSFMMHAMLGSGDNEFANGGSKGVYTLKAGANDGTITCNGHKLSEYGATNALAVWFEMGQVEFAAADVDENGEIVISIKFPTTQDYRHKYSEGVRIVYLPAEAQA